MFLKSLYLISDVFYLLFCVVISPRILLFIVCIIYLSSLGKDALQYPGCLDLHAACTVKDAEHLRPIAKVVVVPDKGGKSTFACLIHKGLAIVGDILVHLVHLGAFVVVRHTPFADADA